MIEVRYAGVVVGRSAIIRELDTRGLFLGLTEPLPVGTPLVLRIGDRPGAEEVHGKVQMVSEAQELSHAGMRIRFADPRAANLFGTPVEAPAEPEEPAPTVPEPTLAQAGSANTMVAGQAGSAAPDAAIAPSPSGHRRIVVDASADRVRAAAESAEAGDDEDDGSMGDGVETGRIPAPNPSAFGGAGGGNGNLKKGRRNRRR